MIGKWPNMFKYLVVVTVAVASAVAGEQRNCTRQVVDCQCTTANSTGVLTTSSGAPVEYRDAWYTLNTNLISNEHFMDSITHFVRERIPERVVHAKGAGAFGYFQVTHDISYICKAKLFSEVGKKTPIAVRFSLSSKDKGSLDTSRDVRGFAIKFYTEEGNFDIIGFNTPMFMFKDPLLFTSLAHTLRQSPVTNYIDKNAFWDGLSLNPESLHMFLLVFSDRGIPDGYRRIPGFGIHTYEVLNESGESSFVRFHFYPEAGIKNLSVQEAAKIAALDPDYATRDLYEAIARGEHPRWRLCVQILSMNDVLTAGFDVFDVTKVLPLERYPLHDVGWVELNRNPSNYFADVEQMAMCPGNLVHGIKGGRDKLFESRRLAYRDAQNHRLGANFKKLPVNCPFKSHVQTYLRDGVAPVGGNGGGGPNYFPNSFGGPKPCVDDTRRSSLHVYEDLPNNYEQAGDLYANGLTDQERDNLVTNIVQDLCAVKQCIKSRVIDQFTLIHSDLGNRISRGLSSNDTKCL